MLTTTLLLAGALLMADPAAKAPSQLELLKTFRQEFVELTPGQGTFPAEFTMGSQRNDTEGPPRTVRLTQPFAIARYEVPQNLWESVMGSNPSRWKGPRNSVEMLSYDEAVEFCEKATRLLREAKLIEPDQVVRLPSEAEWEYAARAGTDTAYSFGDDPQKLGDYGWFKGNAAGNDPPVGAKQPNDWNLYDVHGYLWEWCSDAWHPSYEGAPSDGSPRLAKEESPEDKLRVLRGGSWKDPAEKLTSTFRAPASRSLRDDAVGLRCVLGRRQPREE